MAKANPMANAIRVTVSTAEADDFTNLLRDARQFGLHVSPRLAEAVSLIATAAREVRGRKFAKQAERDYAKRIEQERRDRERHFMIGGFCVAAIRGDYVDLSSDPDSHLWADHALREVLNKPIPEQSEIRRDCWLVRVTLPQPDTLSEIVGSDCTEDSNADAVHALANRVISGWQARRSVSARKFA
ncbi:hypothetical protein [Sphingomonas sp. Leaf257]|uniref:hypothetical protein n=1 Tax=Sphingomonas sp. Leaf257 TaxID=1736309 RepID=UPI000700C3E2|nr:hypothetical protein [Sphingomonas sp. Leaf257]KQO57691.1 hypothetical protein ASF14_14760 [Sphingomonas sp. Leaf257]